MCYPLWSSPEETGAELDNREGEWSISAAMLTLEAVTIRIWPLRITKSDSPASLRLCN